jgi:hypothetical protein
LFNLIKLNYVVPDGPIARFVFDKDDITKQGFPKRRAFKTETYKGRSELSICGMNGVTDERMWRLGRRLRASENKTVYASISLTTTFVLEFGLSTKSEPEWKKCFPEHGVVLGWSADKSERLQQETDMAAKCSLQDIRYPPP